MNPIWMATLRRHWQLTGGVAICLLLLVLHAVWFLPTARRYEAARRTTRNFQESETNETIPLPPRLFALLNRNSLPAAEALERGNSGQLTVAMLEQLTELAGRSGVAVTLTEPGPMTPQTNSVEVRAHLKLRGSYRDLLHFLAEVDRAQRLDTIERFTISAPGDGIVAELWMKRTVLKQPGKRA